MTETTTTKTRFIVIAWTETIREWDGAAFAADMGACPNMEDRVVARACTWLMAGRATDVRRARQHAETMGARVYTFRPDHGDPLGAAKRKILRGSAAE